MHGGVRLRGEMMRTEDKNDIASIRRSPKNSTFHFHETLIEDDIYTFGGYPVSRSKTFASESATEVFLYTGAAAPPIKHQNLGYDLRTHVLINFNRKTSRTPQGVQRVSPVD